MQPNYLSWLIINNDTDKHSPLDMYMVQSIPRRTRVVMFCMVLTAMGRDARLD